MTAHTRKHGQQKWPETDERTGRARAPGHRPNGGHSRRHGYHRYCIGCGWGFTLAMWQAAAYCPRCGRRVSGAKLRDRPAQPDTGMPPAALCEPEVMPPRCESRVRPSPASILEQRGGMRLPSPDRIREAAGAYIQHVRRNPISGGIQTACVGGLVSAGGVVVTTAGIAAMKVGGVIAGISTLTLFFGARSREGGLARIGAYGVGLGMKIMLVGAGAAMVGQAATWCGAAVAVGGAGVAAVGGVRCVQAGRRRAELAGTSEDVTPLVMQRKQVSN